MTARRDAATTFGLLSALLPEDFAAIAASWADLAFTLGAPPELTLDVLAWADDHIPGGHRRFDTAEALAASVRDYLLNRADAFGMELGDFSQPGTSLQSLTALFEQEYERRLSVYTAALQTYYAAGGRDRTADYLQQGFVPVNSPWYPVDTAQRQLDEFQYFGGSGISGLADALNNNYTRSPDYTLLLLVASILFEPVDWVVTGVEIIGNLAEGDLGAAVINVGFAIAPFFGGWVDNFGSIRYAPDDLPSGGITSGAADDADNLLDASDDLLDSTVRNADEALNAIPLSARTDVRVYDEFGNPLTEIDEVDVVNRILIENKTATGLEPNATRTDGSPIWTREQSRLNRIDQWATQLREQMDGQIDALTGNRASYSAQQVASNPNLVPSLDNLRSFNTIEIRINSSDPYLVSAVEREIASLRAKYSDWTIRVIYGTSES